MEPTKGGLFSVRRAAAADAEAILGLITDLAVQHNARDMIVYTADDLRRIGFEAEKPQFEAFVAENTDGKIIGCVVFFERFSTWKGPSIHIEDIIAIPQSRGTGVGEALLNAVAGTARERGAERIELDVEADNEGAIRFYKRKGFDIGGWYSGKLYL